MVLGHLKNSEVSDDGQTMVYDEKTDLNETLCQYLETWSLITSSFCQKEANSRVFILTINNSWLKLFHGETDNP